MSQRIKLLSLCALALFITAVPAITVAQKASGNDDLAGAWQGSVQFTTGAFAATKDLKFMYAFAAGGTMTESSNYDAAPPVPPAYGVWRKVGARRYEAKYHFYLSKAASSAEALIQGGGWAPDGYGTLTQKITLSANGQSFESTLTLQLFGGDGKPVDGGGVATASGTRIAF